MEKLKITSIDPVDRLSQRDADTAVAELRGCITGFNECLKELGRDYPGTIAIGAIVYGQPTGVLAIAASKRRRIPPRSLCMACGRWLGS